MTRSSIRSDGDANTLMVIVREKYAEIVRIKNYPGTSLDNTKDETKASLCLEHQTFKNGSVA